MQSEMEAATTALGRAERREQDVMRDTEQRLQRQTVEAQALQDKLSVVYERQVETLRSEVRDLQSRLHAEQEATERQKEAERQRLEEAHQTERHLQSEVAVLRAEVTHLTTRERESQERMAEVQREGRHQAERLAAMEATQVAKEEAMRGMERQRQAVEEEVQTLRSELQERSFSLTTLQHRLDEEVGRSHAALLDKEHAIQRLQAATKEASEVQTRQTTRQVELTAEVERFTRVVQEKEKLLRQCEENATAVTKALEEQLTAAQRSLEQQAVMGTDMAHLLRASGCRSPPALFPVVTSFSIGRHSCTPFCFAQGETNKQVP